MTVFTVDRSHGSVQINNIMQNEIQPITSEDSQIVLYQPDETINLEVRLDIDNDTVWLTKRQMADLFGRDRSTISRHIAKAAEQGEIDLKVGRAFFAQTTPHGAIEGKTQTDEVEFYNLDVIISVGYRVHSPQGVAFRRWATSVLRDYLLRGYAVNQQLLAMQRQIETRFDQQSERILRIEDTQAKQQQQLDFFIRTSTPPAEMVFFNGEFFTARVALENLIKTARTRAIIIDGYIDAKTFDILGTRSPGVIGQIYTVGVGAGITRLRDEHNRQVGVEPIEVFKWRNESHDRWLIIDDQLWHCGHSLNALGGKMSAITLMGKSPDDLLAEVQ